MLDLSTITVAKPGLERNFFRVHCGLLSQGETIDSAKYCGQLDKSKRSRKNRDNAKPRVD